MANNKILYNVTVIIDNSVHDEWVRWMVDVHIPEVMATGVFETYQMQRVLTQGSEGGTSYAIQYLAADMEAYELYERVYAPKLQAEHSKRYEGLYGAFRTLMEVVSQG